MMRRNFFGFLIVALAIMESLPALAQSWPDRPVKLILPYGPGGGTDLIGRPWAEKLSQALGQQFVVENRGGASGMIGTEIAAKASPDGYTFLLTPNAPLSVLPQLRKTPYDPILSFSPVGRVGDQITGFVVHPSVGVKTFPDLIAYAKAKPGKLAFGSSGLGTSTHLRIEMLKYKAGVDILHVPYRGSADALNDLLSGNIQMMNELSAISHVKGGKVILLAVNHTERYPEFPNVPTLKELGYEGADVPIWFSIQAPSGVSKDVIAKFNRTILDIAKTDAMKARMQAINVLVPLQTPEEMARFLENDIKANSELIKAADIKIE